MVGEILIQQRAATALRGQAQHGLAPEPLRQQRALAASAARAHPHEGLVEEVAVLEAPRGVLPRDHGEVDVAARDQADALA